MICPRKFGVPLLAVDNLIPRFVTATARLVLLGFYLDSPAQSFPLTLTWQE
jgi:hypothetical protein